MNPMRARAKAHFPTVLLTLLSIVQALALELLWSHISETDALYELTWLAVLSWVQVATTLVGIVLIWVVYASNVMRLSWVPATIDSVFPLIIGLLEFMLVAALGPDTLGAWFALLGVVVALMNWTTHHTLVRTRRDPDNNSFFRDRGRATLRDFAPQIGFVGGLLLAALGLRLTGHTGWFAMSALLATVAMLGWQFLVTARFWEISVAEEPGAVAE